MALLGNGFDDPQSSAIMALAGGLLRGDFGGGLLAANDAFSQHKANALKTQLLQAQLGETQAQAQERTLKAQREQEAIDLARRKQAALPGLFGGGMMPAQPGQIGSGSFGSVPAPAGGDMPQRQPGGGQFDVQGAIRAGFSPKEIMEYAALRNANQDEVARTIEGRDAQNRPVTTQYDKFGRPVGAPVEQWKAPVFQNLGGRTAAIDPVSLGERGSFAQTMSPEGRDASARGWATVRQGEQRLAMDQANGAAGKAPAGYRFKPDGNLEFIPGGPADPNAAKRAAPTEFQGKSATYGARAQEADKIISSLDGKYSPAAINAKVGAGNVPMIGGALEAGGNALLSDAGQKAEQAQRDFINAVLRQESGAAISASEFDNARKQYFPQPFDSAAVRLQKARNRQTAIQGFLNNARPGSVAAVAEGGATGSFDQNDPLGLRK